MISKTVTIVRAGLLHARGSLPQVSIVMIFCLGVALRAVSSMSPRLIHPDELFQELEPAHRLAFGYGVVTWEWRDGIRSWVLPWTLSVLMRIGSYVSPHPFAYLLLIKVVLIALSLPTIWFVSAWCRSASGVAAGYIGGVGAAVWYHLVVYASHSLAEVVATDMLLPGILIGYYGLGGKRHLKIAFLLCGLAVAIRVQVLPLVLVAAVITGMRLGRRSWRPIALSTCAPVIAMGGVDWISLGTPFQSYWKYVWVNVVDGASRRYGTYPWYWYVGEVALQYGPIAGLAIIGSRRSPFLGALALTSLVSMSLFGHKENRFIYTLSPLLIALASVGIVEASAMVQRLTGAAFSNGRVILYGCLTVVTCSFLLHGMFPYWNGYSGSMMIVDQLALKPGVCGIGLYETPWWDTGGYTHLHRNIPIVVMKGENDDKAVNTLIAREGTYVEGFTKALCEGGMCLYESRRGCAPGGPVHELNNYLKETGN